MSDLVIETAGLRKVYGSKVAVDDLTLQVPQGEVFGFLGPNGAGKSTSVKMLLGLVGPTSGDARVLGKPVGDQKMRSRIGFLPEHFRFHEWLRARELLDLHGRLYGMSVAERRQRIPELLELVGLAANAERPIAGFSKGMLQRIGLAQALLNEPRLLFLDEPTSALDPFGRMLVRNIIHDLKARGTTVFLNSHLLGEVEATCDRVTFIKAGRVLQTLLLRDLNAGNVLVELRVSDTPPDLLQALDAIALEWRRVDAITAVGSDSADRDPTAEGNGVAAIAVVPAVSSATMHQIELTLANESLVPVIAERVIDSGARLYGLTPRRVSLEQTFLDVVGREDSGQ